MAAGTIRNIVVGVTIALIVFGIVPLALALSAAR